MPGRLCKMSPSRTVLMAWILAVLSIDKIAADSEITASIGKNVLLPCPCSKTTVEVVWQIDTTVVNHYKAEWITEPSSLSQDRSRFELNIEKGECSLLLLSVSESDQKKFTCYTFDKYGDTKEDHVYLKISEKRTADSTQSPEFTSKTDNVHGKTTVGASLSVVAGIIIILAFTVIGILLMRRRRQRMQRMENHLDPQSGLPIMHHSPV